jgi:Holliday junction DNA helicase RuvA
MINYLVGRLELKKAPFVVLEVNGIGYEIQVSLNAFGSMPDKGEDVKLLTHFVVREDAQLLYGFIDSNERQLFRSLIKVNGVGPKLALAILSGMTVDVFTRFILSSDVAALTKLPGVGKKTAERLIIEMKDRLSEWQDKIENLDDGVNNRESIDSKQRIIKEEAKAALVTLGYKLNEAEKALDKLDLTSIDSSESAIRMALQTMLKV